MESRCHCSFRYLAFAFYGVGIDQAIVINQVIKKAQRLIIPYIMIGICWLFPIRMLINYPYYNGLSIPHIIFKSILLGKDNGHLWFLPTLFIITTATSCIFQILDKSSAASLKVPIVFGVSIYLYHFGIASSNRYINLAEANAIWFALGLTIHYLETNKWFESYKKRKSISIFLILFFFVNLLKQLAPPIAATTLTCMAVASIYCVIPQKANRLTEKISKNSMGIYLFHSPLVYISFTYWPNIAPIAMATINLIGFGAVAYILTNLIRTINLGWIIGETLKAPRLKQHAKQ